MATPRNADYTKTYNRKLFLRILREGPATRTQIVRRMGLTRAGVSLIADELLAEGQVEEMDGAPENASRKKNSAYLRLRAGHMFAVGVYLSRDGCTAGVVDFCGAVKSRRELTLSGYRDVEKLEPLVSAISEMTDACAIRPEQLIGVGFSAPGPLDSCRGKMLNPPGFEYWRDTDIGGYLAGKLHLPVYLEDNSACLARYNYKKPGADDSENYLLLLVDSGVGGGIVSGGKVLLDLGATSGELGHISIDYRGKRCACGNVGCLEAYASVPNLLRGSCFSDWKTLVDADTPEAAVLLRRECEYLAAGIVTVANMIHIDRVLLAGDIQYGYTRIAGILEDLVNARAIRRNLQRIHVVPSFVGPDAKLLAAAEVAFDRYLTTG